MQAWFNKTEDQFTPHTLSHLNKEIKANGSSLDNLDEICKNSPTKPSINEAFLKKRKYLLEYKSKHLNSVLIEYKRVYVNDTDVNGLCK